MLQIDLFQAGPLDNLRELAAQNLLAWLQQRFCAPSCMGLQMCNSFKMILSIQETGLWSGPILCLQEDVRDVQREVQVLRLVGKHENVAELIHAYEDSAYVHLVLELCEGGELFDRVVAKGTFTEKMAAGQSVFFHFLFWQRIDVKIKETQLEFCSSWCILPAFRILAYCSNTVAVIE